MSRILPILFNTDMVRAILDGRKMVTRRVIKFSEGQTGRLPESGKRDYIFYPGGIKYAPYQPGDILYVRETYCPNYFDEGIAGYRSDGMRGNTNAYRADYYKDIIGDVVPEPKWKPSIHMPKSAARIWLKVMNVRVERLQEITEEQTKAEGLEAYTKDKKIYKYAVSTDWWKEYHRKHRKDFAGNWWQDMPKTAKEAYSYLWNSTIKKSDCGKYGWEANPWVWVIEFERCEKPEEG